MKNFVKGHVIAMLAILSISQIALGQAAAQEETEAVSIAESRPFYFESLKADEPNFFGYAIPYNNDALDDEEHLAFNLSVKYPLWIKPDEMPPPFGFIEKTGVAEMLPHRTVFIYNGDYDFYLNSTRYESAPIISRRQNPGAALEWDCANSLQFRLGYFHESNGQTLSTSNDYAQAVTDHGEEYALSQVSRGWDYANIRFLYDSNPRREKEIRSCWRYSLELRHYFDLQGFGTQSREDNIFWEPVAHQPSIEEYDGLRSMIEYTFDKGNGHVVNGGMGRMELRSGIGSCDGLAHVGGKYTLGIKLGNTWVTTFYFDGYGKEPASYHLRTQYFGVGIELH